MCYCGIAQTTIQRDGYTLIATVTDEDPRECSIKCGTRPTSDAYLDIPSVVVINDKEYTVTSIASSAFSGIENFIGDLILPSSIAYINGGAFQGCSGFTGHLVFPANCGIYKDAFSGCDGFTTVTLSPGVKIEHTNAFGNNSSNLFPNVTTVYLLTEEDLPNKVASWINGLGNNVIRPEDQLDIPTISPDDYLYTNTITNVVINGNTDGATIYYTIDGTDWLTATSGKPLTINGSTTITEPIIIKFYTEKDGKQSPTIVAEYTFKAAEPVLSPESELPFEGEIEVSITCETANATIYYTTDGSDPTASSTPYNGPITISETTTIKAFARNNNYSRWIDSEIVSAIYTKKGTALAPVFTPAPGTYSYSEEGLTISINCNNEGTTTYHYTTDGSTPTPSCSVYNGPITVSKNTTIKAIACCADLTNSAVSTATYTITQTVAKPTFDTVPGNYNNKQTVSINCKTEGVTIYYTTDGSTPTTSSAVYDENKPITIEPNKRTVINAFAVKNGTDTEFEWLDSELASGTYNDNTMVIFIKDGNWSNPNNWSSGYVPNKDGRAAIGANLRIADGEKAEIAYITNVPSSYYTAGTITIEDGGQLIAGEAAIENVKVEKEIAGHGGTNGGWYAISSPMANEINNTYYNYLITEDYDLYYYNESKWYWYNFKESTNNFKYFNLGQGYLYANSNDNTIISVGVPRMKNTVSVSVSYTDDTPNNNPQNYNLRGFNLIGNPFTFDIGWDAISSDGILADGYYTLGTDGTWAAKTSNSEPIKVGMGILVQAIKTSGTININDTPYSQTQQTEIDSKRGMSVNESLSITVANEKYNDVAHINFGNDSEKGLRKIAHMNDDIQMVYVPVNGINYAIANVDNNVNEVPVSFEAYTMGKYTISIDANISHNEVYLLDKLTGEKIDILSQDYTFVATSSDKAERFSLLFVNNNNDDDTESTNQIFAYINNGEIIISDIDGSGDVKIYDMMGRLVIAENANGSAKISTESFTNGIYIINLIDGDGIKTQKIAIRK